MSNFERLRLAVLMGLLTFNFTGCQKKEVKPQNNTGDVIINLEKDGDPPGEHSNGGGSNERPNGG